MTIVILKKTIENEIEIKGLFTDLNNISLNGLSDIDLLFGDDVFYDSRTFKPIFSKRPQFNGDISNWDVSNIESMSYTFYKSHFNGDISNWNVSKVKYMTGMFLDSPFNGDLSNWNVKNLEDTTDIFKRSPLEGREPWWYVLSPLFNDDYYSMFDSLDFGWINLERKVIYGDKLIKTLKRGYNTQWNGELPNIFGFEIL